MHSEHCTLYLGPEESIRDRTSSIYFFHFLNKVIHKDFFSVSLSNFGNAIGY